MRRSFSDRIFGGVCGGLASALRVSPWLVRALFAILSVLSLGTFALLYIGLWWLAPLESPLIDRRGLPTLIALALIVVTAAAWYARDNGLLITSDGTPIFWQAAAVVLALLFFIRQIR
ncbi:MAG: PspC domain-containing protein [Chloroflexota bacterium]|nr:PspC domain-containing protein [Chloroflexota bacterium]